MFAVRNIRLCTKDCLCLYVCPTHATDTETGQIDKEKCIGCGKCASACPSGAISMVPKEMPAQRTKVENVVNSLLRLVENKVAQERIAQNAMENAEDELTKKFAKAIMLSNHLMAEDIIRESGYMLPQSDNAKALLQKLVDTQTDENFPADTVKALLAKL